MKRTLLFTLAVGALAGCSRPAESDNLPVTANINNNSPEAQSAGAAPLINPDVPPPGKPIVAVKR